MISRATQPKAAKKGAADGAPSAPTSAEQWLDLEGGVPVQFQVFGKLTLTCCSGEYWLTPARFAIGNVIRPSETVTDAPGNIVTNPVGLPSEGITHHSAPPPVLALVGDVPSVSPYGPVLSDDKP